MPSMELLEAMGKFNEEMVKAGVMLAGEGLQASSQGARVYFGHGGKTSVVDGPFAETKELIAGFWLIQVKSKEEAVECQEDAGLLQGLVVLHHGGHGLGVGHGRSAGRLVPLRDHQHHEPHGTRPLGAETSGVGGASLSTVL